MLGLRKAGKGKGKEGHNAVLVLEVNVGLHESLALLLHVVYILLLYVVNRSEVFPTCRIHSCVYPQ